MCTAHTGARLAHSHLPLGFIEGDYRGVGGAGGEGRAEQRSGWLEEDDGEGWRRWRQDKKREGGGEGWLWRRQQRWHSSVAAAAEDRKEEREERRGRTAAATAVAVVDGEVSGDAEEKKECQWGREVTGGRRHFQTKKEAVTVKERKRQAADSSDHGNGSGEDAEESGERGSGVVIGEEGRRGRWRHGDGEEPRPMARREKRGRRW